jgi:hypothetical protein
MMTNELPRMRGTPERIFISVDESTGRSTISFSPADVGTPIQREGDKDGAQALKDAKTLLAKYPGATIHGPHFHAAPTGRVRPRKRSM